MSNPTISDPMTTMGATILEAESDPLASLEDPE